MAGRNTAITRLLPALRQLRQWQHSKSVYTLRASANSTGENYLRALQPSILSRSLSTSPLYFSVSSSETTSQQAPVTNGQDGAPVPLVHFRKSTHPKVAAEEKEGVYEAYTMPHPVWSNEELYSVEIEHTPPEKRVDRAAYYCVQTLRLTFDVLSGYAWGKKFGTLDEKKWLSRIIFLETVAGVPGMIGAMVRHLKSLRRMTRDHGWIHTLLEEAENERMHLLTALELRQPGPLFKMAVLGTQGVFVNLFWISYFLSPRFCHKFVGYLEEEAVKTYTYCIESLDKGELKMWSQTKAPPIAIAYWRLPADAMMRDVLLAIRADEGHHREVNHTLGSMKPTDRNPYGLGR